MIEAGEILGRVLEPIQGHDRRMLRKAAQRLKGESGEAWAIGEMVERACIYLDVAEWPPEQSPPLNPIKEKN